MGVLTGSTVLVTGGGRRVGKFLCLAAAKAGANVIVHYAHSETGAVDTVEEIARLGVEAEAVQQDFSRLSELDHFIDRCWEQMPFDILVNNAAIFENLSLEDTTLRDWDQHMAVNLTAPFLLSRAFLRKLPADQSGRIINILDWRALRPGKDHFPYTISKAGLAALTKSTASAAAPRVQVNGIALGAILPPESDYDEDELFENYPIKRWAELSEVGETFLFFAGGPAYITGEVLYLDGGRHLI